MSSSVDSLVKTLVDISHKTLKKLKGETIDNNETLNIVNEIEILVKDDKYKHVFFKD